MRIRRVRVSVEPSFTFDREPMLRVELETGGRIFKRDQVMPEDDFESRFDIYFDTAKEELRRFFKEQEGNDVH